jgi:hypothetical protein
VHQVCYEQKIIDAENHPRFDIVHKAERLGASREVSI